MVNRSINMTNKLAIAFFLCLYTVGVLAVAQQAPPPACPTCAEEDVGDICGGVECGHGMEYDFDDCAAAYAAARLAHPTWSSVEIDNFICSETNGGVGNCECYACGNVDTCEEYIVDVKAWCGKSTAGTSCVTHMENADPPQRSRYSFQTVILSGAACTPLAGPAGGYIEVAECGGAVTPCSCVASNACIAVFGTYTEDLSRSIQKCGPGAGGTARD